MRKLILALVATVITAGTAFSEPTIDVSHVPGELTVGDRLELLVTVRPGPSPETREVRFQPWGETLGSAEILEVGPVERLRLSGSVAYRQRLVLTLFQLGTVTLPPIEAVIVGSERETPLTSASTTVVVHSVLPEDDADPEAKPPIRPRRLELGNRFWWATGALLATCLLALGILWQQAGNLEADEEGRPSLAPMDELRRSLAALRHQSEIVPLHAELSLAVRRFLGRVLEFPAPESTTTEIRQALRQNDLSPELTRQTGELLASCDMVKFARRNIDLQQARSRIGEAETIADGLLETLPPESPDVPAEVS